MNTEQLRNEFEAAAADQVSSLARDANGLYLANDADTAWWAWQHQAKVLASKNNVEPSTQSDRGDVSSVIDIWNKLTINQSFLKSVADHSAMFDSGSASNITFDVDDKLIEVNVKVLPGEGVFELRPCFYGEIVREIEAARVGLSGKHCPTKLEQAEELYANMFDDPAQYPSHGKWMISSDGNQFAAFVTRATNGQFVRDLFDIRFTSAGAMISKTPVGMDDSIEHAFRKAYGDSASSMLHDFKARLANELLESYELPDMTVVSADGWDTSDPLDYIKRVYVIYTDGDHNQDSQILSFHVRFDDEEHNGVTVLELYALDVSSGEYVGFMPKQNQPSPR